MLKVKIITVLLLCVSFAGYASAILAASGTTPSSKDGSGDSDIIAVIPYTVVRNDNLTRITTRFMLRISDIVAKNLNPNLALRNNPNLIYSGEIIRVPVHARFAVPKPVLQAAVPAVPPASGAKEVKNKSEAASGRSNEGTSRFLQSVKNATWLPAVALAVAIIFVLGAIIYISGVLDRMKLKKIYATDLQSINAKSIGETTPYAIAIAAIMRMKADDAVDLLNDTVVHDEQGNGVQFKNFVEFMKKRPRYGQILLSQFDEAMGGGEKTTKGELVGEAVTST